MPHIARRRWLAGAAALPGVLALGGCTAARPLLGSVPPGTCRGPEEQISEEELRTEPKGYTGHPPPAEEHRRFLGDTLALSPDGTMLAAAESLDRVALDLAEDAGVILWDTATGEVIRRISTPARGVIAWHPDGSRLAIGEGRRIVLVDLEGRLERTLLGHELPEDRTAYLGTLVFRPDGGQLASAGTDDTVRLWDMDPESCGEGHLLHPRTESNQSVSYSPDGSVLATGGLSRLGADTTDNPPELWDPETGGRQDELTRIPGKVFSLGYTPDGALIAVTDDPPALLAVETNGVLMPGPVPPSAFFMLLATGPGPRIAVMDPGSELLIWNRLTGTESRFDAPEGVQSMVWSSSGDVLYCLTVSEGVLAFDGTDWRTFDLP